MLLERELRVTETMEMVLGPRNKLKRALRDRERRAITMACAHRWLRERLGTKRSQGVGPLCSSCKCLSSSSEEYTEIAMVDLTNGLDGRC